MRPRAILKHHSNSYPFEERNLDLSTIVKVGRAVAKCKPATDNAIFDCKVLSRNHATLWFEDGKFYIKDTCSSNGTFINNNRLSPANEDSTGKEIHSNDVIQFGVEVVDSTNKITHSCIILRIKLFYPNGSEAWRSATMFNIPTINMLPPYYSYTQMIEREQRIYQKLNEIEDVLAAAHPIADMMLEAKETKERLLEQINDIQIVCDSKTKCIQRLEVELSTLKDRYDEQEDNNARNSKSMRAKIKAKDNELEKLHLQLDRIVKHDNQVTTTALVLLMILLVMGGFDMLAMFSRLI